MLLGIHFELRDVQLIVFWCTMCITSSLSTEMYGHLTSKYDKVFYCTSFTKNLISVRVCFRERTTPFKVKWFGDGAQFNTNHEMIFWLWSSSMAKTSCSSRFPFAAIPMRYLPTKNLRAKANRTIVNLIAWDSILALMGFHDVSLICFPQNTHSDFTCKRSLLDQ